MRADLRRLVVLEEYTTERGVQFFRGCHEGRRLILLKEWPRQWVLLEQVLEEEGEGDQEGIKRRPAHPNPT